MKIELEAEEARALTVLIADRLIGEAGLSAADVAALRKWRTSLTPGSDGVREITAKVNADIGRTLENKKRSAIIKPDWK